MVSVQKYSGQKKKRRKSLIRSWCDMTSAVLRSALCSSLLELQAGLLPAAHRFNPDHGLFPPRVGQTLSPHFPNFA